MELRRGLLLVFFLLACLQSSQPLVNVTKQQELCVLQMWVGTAQSNVYKVSLGDLKAQLVTTCHYDCINNVTFPQYVCSVSCWFG